ncbi:MAG: ROK family protein [Thermodesulfobacteriota bacterium]
MDRFLIGVDFGGTNIRMGVVTPEGKVLKKVRYTTDVSKGGAALFEQLVSNLSDLIRKYFKESDQLIGIGIGVAGPVDMEKGIMIAPPNLPTLDGFPVRAFLQERIPSPIFIENDANAFTLGEGWVGAAKGCNNYCGITLGTGVGGGVVVAGKILRGSTGMGGEVGHMVLDPDGPSCGCGGRGCLEVYASGTGIRRMAVEVAHKRGSGRISEWVKGNAEDLNSEKVFEAARKGDLEAQQIFNVMGRFLGLGLVNLVNLFNPEKIVIGGRVARAWDYFIPSVVETVQERAMKGPREKVRIVRAECGDDAGMLGAAYAVLRRAR